MPRGHPLLSPSARSPAPFSVSGRLSGWPGAAVDELQGWWLQDQRDRALSGCRGQLDIGPWRGKRVPWCCVTAGRKRRDGAEASVLADRMAQILQWCHGARSLQLCCAEQPGSSLALVGAGSREESRHLHFRRLFSGAGEKPRRDEIVTKETRETGPSAGKWWAVRRGEGRAFYQTQGPHMRLSTFSGPQEPAQAPIIQPPGCGAEP